MGFLVFLQRYWGELGLLAIAGLIFFCGWHLRGWKEAVRQEKEISRQLDTAFNTEKKIQTIHAKAEVINQQAMKEYAKNNNRCFISAEQLRLIQQNAK